MMQLEDLTFIKKLGEGSFGQVFLTTKKGTTELFATKKMDRQYVDSPEIKKYFVNEIKILKEVKHRNIVKIQDVKQTKNHYYIVMEYCNGGSLTECLKKYRKLYDKPFSENIVQYLMREIVDAIKYLHNKKIIHRDLKLDNILVKFDNEKDKDQVNMMNAKVKIIDFGFAIHLDSKNLAYSALGSPINMDPNILRKLSKKGKTKTLGYDAKADIWSLGTICYEMLIGHAVFDAESMDDLLEKEKCGKYSVPTSLSREVVSFLNGMLQYDSKKRFDANELSMHRFLTKKVSDFTPMYLQKDSSKANNKKINKNIRKNNSIWADYSENEEQLMNIPKNLDQADKIEKKTTTKVNRFNISPNRNQKGTFQGNGFANNPNNQQLNYPNYPQMKGGMPGMNQQSGQTNTMISNNPMGGSRMISPFGMTAPGVGPSPYAFNGYNRINTNPTRQNPFVVDDSCKIF